MTSIFMIANNMTVARNVTVIVICELFIPKLPMLPVSKPAENFLRDIWQVGATSDATFSHFDSTSMTDMLCNSVYRLRR